MSTMTHFETEVTVGIDTHRDLHVAAVLDSRGRLLGTRSFPTTGTGYWDLHDWVYGFGSVAAVGIEGTGSYGAGITRFLTGRGIRCIEVIRPNRQHRRRHGKSDTADAIAAARAVQSGEATAQPRSHHGAIEGLRTNRVALRSAQKARTQAINQLRALIVTAPDELRCHLQGLSIHRLVGVVSRLRPQGTSTLALTKHAMRSLARRIRHLEDEINDLKAHRDQLINHTAPPELLNQPGVGPAVATDLLIAYGSNPNRIHSEAAFAALCGVSTIDASSGQQQRHRLNRGGDRQANHALWRIVITRMTNHPPTRHYITTRTTAGKTKREAIRSLKRYVARQTWRILTTHPPQLDTP